jgi:hypothetical protein
MEDEDKVTVTLGDEIKISGVRVQHQGRRRFLLLSKILETLHSQYGWKDLRATNAVKPWKDNEAITFAVYLSSLCPRPSLFPSEYSLFSNGHFTWIRDSFLVCVLQKAYKDKWDQISDIEIEEADPGTPPRFIPHMSL